MLNVTDTLENIKSVTPKSVLYFRGRVYGVRFIVDYVELVDISDEVVKENNISINFLLPIENLHYYPAVDRLMTLHEYANKQIALDVSNNLKAINMIKKLLNTQGDN